MQFSHAKAYLLEMFWLFYPTDSDFYKGCNDVIFAMILVLYCFVLLSRGLLWDLLVKGR